MNRHASLQPKLAYVTDDGTLVVKHSSGFFSCCTIRLRKIINYYNEYSKLPIVDSSAQWELYKDAPGDITDKLYKTKNDIIELPEHVIFSTDTCEDQFSNYNLINFTDVNKFIEKYFTVSDEIIIIKNQLLNKYNIDVNQSIAICYRGSDKRSEINVPTHDHVIETIKALHAQYPRYQLLIQSDEIEFYNRLNAESIEFIQFDETFKVHATQRAIQHYVPIGQRLPMAQNFLAIMQILSSCAVLATNSGNVGIWLCLFRGHTNNFKQL